MHSASSLNPAGQVVTRHLPKDGNSETEYEDAFAKRIDSGLLALALADGATESSFAAEWAKQLVRAFRDQQFTDLESLRSQVAECSSRWHEIIGRRRLRWYAAEKARQGAFATLLGVQFQTNPSGGERLPSGEWSAIAVGDTCLFQVRAHKLHDSFPIRSSRDFGDTPFLISSNFDRNQRVWEAGVEIRLGEWQAGDLFIAATDALAAWFMRQSELDKHPWEQLLYLAEMEENAFGVWVVEQRAAHQLKNDDVTLIVIRL